MEATPNADEQIEVHWKPLEEVLEMAVDGRIRDAKTIAALFRATHLSTKYTHAPAILLGCVEFDSGGEVIRFFAAFPLDVAPHTRPLLGQYWGIL